MSLLSKSRKAQEEIQKQNCISINEKVVQFANLGKAFIKVRHEGIDPFVALEAVMPGINLYPLLKCSNVTIVTKFCPIGEAV